MEISLDAAKGQEPDNKHLWDQFAILGERIGDGDLGPDEKWVAREYKRLSKILVPEIRESFQQKRKQKAENINAQMQKLFLTKRCTKESCGGELKQSRSGSKVCYCTICKSRYKAK